MKVVSIYRTLLPLSIRIFVYKLFLGKLLFIFRGFLEFLKMKIYKFSFSAFPPKTEKENALYILAKIGISPYPYFWRVDYENKKYESHVDPQNGLPFVIHEGKRLYFKRNTSSDNISSFYRNLLIEQDVRSAHCYVDSFDQLRDKVLLDVGSAKAFFTLSVIEYINHAYLFECDEEWVEALNATFEPWKSKITIVRKYVSDKSENDFVCLDDYFQKCDFDNLFIKMDIEGYERKALDGCKLLLHKIENVMGAICIYHLFDDEMIIGDIMREHGCLTSVRSGYLYFNRDLRHALLNFKK